MQEGRLKQARCVTENDVGVGYLQQRARESTSLTDPHFGCYTAGTSPVFRANDRLIGEPPNPSTTNSWQDPGRTHTTTDMPQVPHAYDGMQYSGRTFYRPQLGAAAPPLCPTDWAIAPKRIM
jgi:hypothetical protein